VKSQSQHLFTVTQTHILEVIKLDSDNSPIELIAAGTEMPVTTSVIWLHGLGASGDDFVPLVPELGLAGGPGVRFIFPHMSMRGWFDITSLEFEDREQDLKGMQESVDLVNQLIEKEIAAGIKPERIVIAGFSQGGAIALLTALQGKYPLAGVMALSTYLPDADATLARYLETVKAVGTGGPETIPVFMAHGQFDDVIRIQFAEESHAALAKAGFNVEWHAYPMPHSVSPEEIDDIASWLKKRL